MTTGAVTKGRCTMQSVTRRLIVALVAVFALGAVASSAALASPEWYVKKGGTYSKVKEAVKFKGNFRLEEIVTPKGYGLPYNEPFGLKCTSTSEGELKSGGITDITIIRGPTCQALDTCERVVENVYFYNIPWQLELYTEGTEIRDKFVSGPNGLAGFGFVCKTRWLGEKKVETYLSTSTHMTNLSSGLVEAAFDAKSATTKWSGGGTIEWKGQFLTVEPVAGTGVEAIKVE
jgi:hypothetical protein